MSWFPILVLYVESNERVVCNNPKDIRSGVAFKVLETRYRRPIVNGPQHK